MAYIFLDESGDLGFNFQNTKTSKYFIITCLFIKNKSPIEKIVSKIFKSFTAKERRSHCGVLHCFKEKPKTRYKLFNLLNQKDISILSIYLNKKKVYSHLKDEKHILYNYITNILLDRIYTKKLVPLNEPIRLVVSQRETNKFLNQNFEAYLIGQTYKNHKAEIHIEIKTPHSEKCLQIVDFVCWAIFRKREWDDETYYNLIKQKIVEENPLFS